MINEGQILDIIQLWAAALTAITSFISAVAIVTSIFLSHRWHNGTDSKIEKMHGRFHGLSSGASDLFAMTNAASVKVSHESKNEDDFHHANFAQLGPIGLTDRGKKIASRLGARETVKQMTPTLLKIVPKDATVLDIQRVCFDYALHELLDDVDTDLKRLIHREIYDDGGDDENTLMVYGIMLRDAAIERLTIKR